MKIRVAWTDGDALWFDDVVKYNNHGEEFCIWLEDGTKTYIWKGNTKAIQVQGEPA